MQHFYRVGNGEFGEVYHLATELILLEGTQDLTVIFENFPQGKEFFDFLSIDLPNKDERAKEKPLPSSAETIFLKFYPGCLAKQQMLIRSTGKKSNWINPFPELLTNDIKLLIWHRTKSYKCYRNSTIGLLVQLSSLCKKNNTIALVVGEEAEVDGLKFLGKYYEHDFFKTESIAKQLWFIDQLFTCGGVIASVGMMSGAMDGAAMFFGHKTIFFARQKDAAPRMTKLSLVVPNLKWLAIEYQESFQKLTNFELAQLQEMIWQE